MENSEKFIEREQKTDQKIESNFEKKESGLKIECPERQEVADKAISELITAFKSLGIDNFKLPKIKIKFVESENIEYPVLGRVGEVHQDGSVAIFYDKRFSNKESAEEIIKEVREKQGDYPSMEQTLKHELAHVAMWSITGLDRQPATRLIDEGFASLIENTASQIPIQQTKNEVIEGLKNEPKYYERCLDFSNPIDGEKESLNEAEYVMGRAILLWIRELKGNDKMIELIIKSPEKTRRNDDEAPDVGGKDPILHKLNDEYSSIIANVKERPFEETVRLLTIWEGKQFEAALLEISGFQSLEQLKKEFLKWINDG